MLLLKIPLRIDRNKLVFNICSNKSNSFDRPTLDLFFEVSRAAYRGRRPTDDTLHASPNPDYWKQLFVKFSAIHVEIQDASRSINKSFGTLQHHSAFQTKNHALSHSRCALLNDIFFRYF
jgi:hypothetical protein